VKCKFCNPNTCPKADLVRTSKAIVEQYRTLDILNSEFAEKVARLEIVLDNIDKQRGSPTCDVDSVDQLTIQSNSVQEPRLGERTEKNSDVPNADQINTTWMLARKHGQAPSL
jgi:hypothetical protein